MTNFINKEINPDVIFWTGDSTTHAESYYMTYEDKVDQLTYLNNLLKETFKTIPIFAAIGNHDFAFSH